MPVIPGHATQPKTRKTLYWEHRNLPTIYKPVTVNLQLDDTEFYYKTPQEMSRYELAELEAEMRAIADGGAEEDEEPTKEDIEKMK